MKEEMFQFLMKASENFWWKFTLIYVHHHEESQWWPFVKLAYGEAAAAKLKKFIDAEEDRSFKVNGEMSIEEILICMRVVDMSFHGEEESQSSQLSRDENKKARRCSTDAFACKICKRRYSSKDAVRKHSKLKHQCTVRSEYLSVEEEWKGNEFEGSF